MNNLTMLRWFIILVSIIVTAALVYSKGLFSALWAADLSGISFIILFIFAILTLFTGVITKRLTTAVPGSEVYEENMAYLQACWYSTELLMALGMIGTLIGFTIMLGPALEGLDVANILMAKSAIFKMASGMSTAILTTLVGLITSQILKLQLINIEISLRD